MKNHGYKTEDIVERISNEMFFSDFIIRDLNFKKENGQEKEAADLFVIYDDVLIAFQIKSKIESKCFSDKSNDDINRIYKKIDAAIGQFNTTNNTLKSGLLKKLKTVRGYPIDFDFNNINKTIGIVILNLEGEEKYTLKERTPLTQKISTEYNNLPIHILKLDDFIALSSELDTMPDFLRYISIRELLLTRNQLIEFLYDTDLLALYKTNYPIIEKAILDKDYRISIEPYIWEEIKEQFSSQFELRNMKNGISLIYDEIIEHIHSSVGYSIDKERYDIGDIESYLEIARELASVPRIIRREIGQAIYNKTVKAINKKASYCIITLPETNIGIFFLAYDGLRVERKDLLEEYSFYSYCSHDFDKIIGIATEPANIQHHSYDAILLRDIDFLTEIEFEDFKNKGLKMFKKPLYKDIEEFQ